MSAALTERPDREVIRNLIDQVELRLMEIGSKVSAHGDDIDGVPVTHHFTPGLYAREIFMPARSIVVSRIHKTEHPFVVSKGRCYVYNEKGEAVEIVAPYFGVTMPGTRRVLYMIEDTVWTTFHPTDLTDVREIEAEIIEPHLNPLLSEVTE